MAGHSLPPFLEGLLSPLGYDTDDSWIFIPRESSNLNIVNATRMDKFYGP